MNIPFSIVAGSIMFHVRRRPADYHPRKRKKKIQQKWNQGSSSELMEYRYEEGFDRLPFFLELNPGELKSKRVYFIMRNLKAYPCMLVKNGLYDCLELSLNVIRRTMRNFVTNSQACFLYFHQYSGAIFVSQIDP